ncbi:MAG: heme-binding domain-containing protein [Ardenticatenia bacterium]|nr:heme-binding domain-containing protein [Ardenticatenia bacterium]
MSSMRPLLSRYWRHLFVLLAVVGVGIQLIPYGHSHENPPVVREPRWDSAHTRELARRACFDCHSNETVWPWYSNIAPISWLVRHDVDEGRRELNFSEWHRFQEADELVEVIQEGEMPPAYYVLLHPGARLSPEEREALIAGLRATSHQDPPGAAP